MAEILNSINSPTDLKKIKKIRRVTFLITIITYLFLSSCTTTRNHNYLTWRDVDPSIGDSVNNARDFIAAVNYYERGTAYYTKGENDLAISEFNRALEINPRLYVVYIQRGLAYAAKGEYDRAILDYNKVLEINPRVLIYDIRAVAYYYKGEYNKAWEDVHKAQGLGYQVNPGFLDALRQASGRQR